MEEKTDKELYREFLLGNKESFEKIVIRHKDAIIYFIQRYVKSVDIAEDLAQDVFVYILINKKNYKFEYSLKTYLYTIAKSKALNYIKRKKRIVELDENQFEDLEELEEKVFKNERAENLRKAIQKLKTEYQNAIYLADIEELSYKEIGHILNKTDSGVKVLIHRARKALEKVVVRRDISMKSNKQFINEIYEKYDEYTKEKQEEKQKNMRKIINMAAVVIVLISSLIVFSEKKVPNKVQLQNVDKFMEDSANLETVGSFENFYQIIKEKSQSNTDRLVFNLEESIIADTSKYSATNEMSSTTNTQVENVDESDVVKVEGQYIYYVADQRIIIIDAQNAETSSKVAEINYKEEKFNPREIYVKNNKLIVIGNETEGYSTTCKTVIEDGARDVAKLADFKTGMILYDISNIKEPKEIRRIMLQGNYISSRMIENNVYFVANQYLYTSQIARNEIKDLNEDDYKPKYEDTTISQEEKCIDFNRIYSLEGTNDTSYLMLAGLNIESDEEADIKTFLGAGQYVYASEKNMYIAVNKEKYGEGYELLGGTTHILKFALEDGKITYKAEADVDGQVNNQFSMDENGEYFRIATTSGRLWNMDKSTSNNLYILNDKLEEVGKVTGFAQEEKIYSVRYVGDKAYVVTFKQTDPLFVIDLSNPTNPQILGELKLPGYSTYLHPYDETHIIGFGYETKENGTRVTTDGLKMVMFDVSDFSNPQVLFKVNIGDSKYTYSELLYNHKAMLFSKEKNIIAFPLYSSAGMKTNSRAAIYQIDLEKGFTLKGEIGNITSEYLKQVERIVFVNDTYYTLSKTLVKVADMETIEVLKEIEI